MPDVVCLRPEADFTRVGVNPPAALSVEYMAPDAPQLSDTMRAAKALVIPAVGPKLPLDLFRDTSIGLVQVTGAGVDRVDVAGLRDLSIAVANVPGGSNEAIAEYATSSAAILLRRMTESTHAIRAGNYADFRSAYVKAGVDELDGRSVGVIGLGTIGKAVARRFRAAGGTILFHDPAPVAEADIAALGAERAELDDLLARADVVTVHVPLLPATENLIDARRLALMKPGAILVQAARGGIVNEPALAAALESGHLAGAAVDVYTTEPPPNDHPLLTLSAAAAARVILTPHIAGVTRQSWATLFREAWDNVLNVVKEGQAPRNVI